MNSKAERKCEQEWIKNGGMKNDFNQSDFHNASMEELCDARRLLSSPHNHKTETFRENFEKIDWGHK